VGLADIYKSLEPTLELAYTVGVAISMARLKSGAICLNLVATRAAHRDFRPAVLERTFSEWLLPIGYLRGALPHKLFQEHQLLHEPIKLRLSSIGIRCA
jgi:hypothetical protein